MKIKEVPIQANYPVHWGTIFQSKFLLAVKLYSLCCYCCTQVIFCTAIYQMDHIWAAAHRPKKSPGLVILEQLGHYFRSVIMEDPVGHLTTPSNQNWLDNCPHRLENWPWRWIFCPEIYTC